MIIYPAIDLKDKLCVRLKRGDMEQATVFNDNPAAQAQIFEQKGYQWIHVVDLNGAFAGKPVNAEAVKSIVQAVSIPVQLGGGIRDMETIAMWLELGVARVILGTVALKNPDLVKQAAQTYPGQIVVGIDAKGGYVATEGWAEASEMKVAELAKAFEDAGVAAIIYTDIDRDGLMKGPNIAATKALAEQTSVPIIASGGVSCDEDIKAIQALESLGVTGVITGRAIYEGKISLV